MGIIKFEMEKSNCRTTELEKLIADALSSVHHHPRHDLNLGYRQAIWAALESDNDKLGHKRRAFLANLTVRQVLPVWHQTFPHDDRPQHILGDILLHQLSTVWCGLLSDSCYCIGH